MQIDINAEALLKQLKIDLTSGSLAQMNTIIDNTPNALKFFKHIFSLNDDLSHLDAFIAPSSSCDFLKIKLRGTLAAQIESFHETVKHWSDKYKVEVEKVANKEVYYIKGAVNH